MKRPTCHVLARRILGWRSLVIQIWSILTFGASGESICDSRACCNVCARYWSAKARQHQFDWWNDGLGNMLQSSEVAVIEQMRNHAMSQTVLELTVKLCITTPVCTTSVMCTRPSATCLFLCTFPYHVPYWRFANSEACQSSMRRLLCSEKWPSTPNIRTSRRHS